jgi:hypothetical protein
MPERIFDRGQRFANASVVAHAAVCQRDVEVHAHENSVIRQGKIFD